MEHIKNLLAGCGVLFVLMILVGVFNCASSQEYTSSARLDILTSTPGYQYPLKGLGNVNGTDYKFGWDKWQGMLVICAAGFVDGAVEGYEFDSRLSFNRKWGVDKYSFFGSHSWDSNWNSWEKFRGSQFDFYHLADDTRKVGYVAGGFMMGRASLKNKRKVHNFFDYTIAFVCSGIWKSAGMYYVRHIDNW